MAKNLFNELYFDIPSEVFFEVLKNKDSGFGYKISLETKHLSPLQKETLNFLINCYKKRLLGYVILKFNTESVGEVKELSRTIEKIEKTKNSFVISNSY